jgi:hypothetical protein
MTYAVGVNSRQHISKFNFAFWDVLPCKKIVDRRFRGKCCLHYQGDEIALMTEAANTSKTSVDNYFTRQYIPEEEPGYLRQYSV